MGDSVCGEFLRMKRIFFFLLLIISIPVVVASNEECGWSNLGSCVTNSFFDKLTEFLLNIINKPIDLIILFIQNILTAEPPLELFYGVWRSVVFALSSLYGLVLLYVAVRFIVSGGSAILRERAKQQLQSTLLLIFSVNASYFLYDLGVLLVHYFARGLFVLVNPAFFRFTLDVSLPLQLVFGSFYLMTLLFTVLVLIIRYVFLGAGVVLLPIGLVLLYLPFSEGYGRWLLNLIGANVIVSIPSMVILVTFSTLLDNPLFRSLKVFLVIAGFLAMNGMILWSWYASVLKTAVSWTEKVVAVVSGWL